MLVIRGAYYYNEENDIIVVPHFTGDFAIVDCDIYERLKELKEEYSEDYVEQVIEDEQYITLNGKRYYYAEWSPMSTDGLILLSDISKLEFNEINTEFEC